MHFTCLWLELQVHVTAIILRTITTLLTLNSNPPPAPPPPPRTHISPIIQLCPLECYCIVFSLVTQDQDQDSLLVKRRYDNHSPGPVIRELVPSSHQRSELSNTILCIFSRWDQRIGEGIPIPDSLGEEATFINICISNGSLKCHRVLISTTPSFGDKVICWYTGFTFKTFI